MTRLLTAVFLAYVLGAASAWADFQGTCPANTVVAGPTIGPDATPSCRPLVASDVPSTSLPLPYTATDNKTGAQTVQHDTFTITTDGTTVPGLIGTNQQDSGLAVVYNNHNGMTLVQGNAIAGYALNNNGIGDGSTGNLTALYGWGQANVNNAWIWGANSLTISKPGLTGGTHQISFEADVNASNVTDNLIGVQVSGGSTVQPNFANAIVVTPVGPGTPPLPWSTGLYTASGAVSTGVLLNPLAPTGTNINSPAITFVALDGAGAKQTFNLEAGPQSLNLFSSIANPALQVNGNMIVTQGRFYQVGPDVVMFESAPHSVVLAPDANITSVSLGNGVVPVNMNGSSALVLGILTASVLPVCNTGRKGNLYTVSDANTPTYNGVLAGGGSSVVPVMCDGSNWRTH